MEYAIYDDFIKLGQLLKVCGLVENGAEAKEVIQSGEVLYNTEVCTQRGKKCYPGDLIEYAGEEIRVV